LAANFQNGEAHGFGLMRDSDKNIIQKGKWMKGEFYPNSNASDEEEIKKIESISLTYIQRNFESRSESDTTQTQMKNPSYAVEAPAAQKDKVSDEKAIEKPKIDEEPKKKIKKTTLEEKNPKKGK
jgi:hypothetical protein